MKLAKPLIGEEEKRAVAEVLESGMIASLHFFDHLKRYSHDELKNSEGLVDEVLSLPVHPALSNQDLETIVGCF